MHNGFKKYYPIDLIPFEKGYDDSIQFKTLLSKILSHQHAPEGFPYFIYQDLFDIFDTTEYHIEDQTRFSMLDRGMTYEIYKKSEDYFIGTESVKKRSILTLCISVLEPFFCIYRKDMTYYYDNNNKFIGQICEGINNTFSTHEIERILSLEELLVNKGIVNIGFSELFIEYNQFKFYGKHDGFNLFNGFFKNDW